MYIKKSLALFCTILALSISSLMMPKVVANEFAPSMRGILVHSQNNQDFPKKPNQSAKSLKAQITEITQYSSDGGYNTLLFQIRSQGEALYRSKFFPNSQFLVKKQGDFTFFDPLKQLLSTANKENIDVYAIINPFYMGGDLGVLDKTSLPLKNPELCFTVGNKIYLSPFEAQATDINIQDIKEIVSKYKVKGIILEGIDDPAIALQDNYATTINTFTDNLSSAIKGINPDIKLGIRFQNSSLSDELITQLAAGFDMVLPTIEGSLDFSNPEYKQNVQKWQDRSGDILAPITNISTIYSPTTGAMITDPNTPVYQVFANQQQGIESMIVDGYRDLRYGFWELSSGLSSLNVEGKTELPIASFNPDQSLKVTHPKNNYRTNLAKFFVTGTSDKNLPVTINGKEVTKNATNGTFGTLVELSNGKNTFIFKQGEDTQTLVIERYTPSATANPISKVTAANPSRFQIAYSGEAFTLRCTAPSGSTVVASLGGKTYPMKQAAATAETSIPATFTVEITLNTASPTDFLNLGKVTYSLTHGGKNSTYTSTGSVYLLGSNAEPMVRVTSDTASVYPTDALVDGVYKSIYKKGTAEKIVSDTTNSVLLASGGYMKKEYLELYNGTTAKKLSLSNISLSDDATQQTYILFGAAGVPFELSQEDNGTITLTMLTTLDVSSIKIPSSALFAEIAFDTDTPSQTKIIFTPHDANAIWGYDIFYSGEDAQMFFKKAPAKSTNPFKPLENIVIVLDPGHGGNDPGALGILRNVGPHESEVNFTAASAIKQRLEQLGATVYMTRDDDKTISLVERARFTVDKLPHISISTHHNSTAESSNSNTAAGVEGYYYYGVSKDLSDIMVRNLTQATNRKYRTSKHANYIVSKYNYTKAMLLEIGFMPNPAEYEQIIDPMELYKTSCAVASGVVELVNK